MSDQNQPKEETTHKMRNLGETLTPHKYKATYVRKGTQGKKPSSLLICIRDENDHELCDHLWIFYVKVIVQKMLHKHTHSKSYGISFF